VGFWKIVAKTVFAVSGWKLTTRMSSNITQCVMIAAPHTSNWDLIYARGAFYLMDIPVRFTVKKEWVDHPLLGWLVKSVGGLGVDRAKNNSLVEAMVDLFRQHDPLVMLITPEGTRKYQPKWRKGFYYTALEAKVPIALGFLDYEKKEAGVGPLIYPTGDYEADLEKILAFYRTKKGRFPAQGVR
jgi:1-acyl-sn-glycerol-3-phosphate acyltransferase